MRSRRSVNLYSTLTLVGAAAAIAFAGACSGAAPQDVLSTDGTASSSGASMSSSGASSSGTTGTSSGGASSGGADASSGSSGSLGPCSPEQEPNDSAGRANELAPSRCGKLGKRDRQDFLTFRLKPTTTMVELRFDGKVRLRIDVNGADTVELTPDVTAQIPFVQDADYIVEVTPLTDPTGDLSWRVDLVEK